MPMTQTRTASLKKRDPKQNVRTELVQACLADDFEKIRELCQILCDEGIMLKDLEFSKGYFQLVGNKIMESGFKPKWPS